MNKLTKLAFLAVVVLLLVKCKFPVDDFGKSQSKRPNIVFIYIDDLGYGDLSCYGNAGVNTLHIDKLANEGIKFTQFYVNAPMCSPSRVAVLTGQYPLRWNITSALGDSTRNNLGGSAHFLDKHAPSVARILQNAGYYTAHVGKWHLGGQRNIPGPLIEEFGFNSSLTSFEGLGERLGLMFEERKFRGSNKFHLSVQQAKLGRGEVRWVKRHDEPKLFVNRVIQEIEHAKSVKKPFYINLWTDAVHTPLEAPPGLRGNRSQRSQYVGVIQNLDTQLGRLFDLIRSDPDLNDNTLIILSSDNGPSHEIGSTGGFRSHKGDLYEGGIREPFIVWGPGFIEANLAGKTNSSTVIAGMDIPPSVLALTGVCSPSDVKFDGIDLSHVFTGKSDSPRDEAVMWVRPTDPIGEPGHEWKNLVIRKDLAIREGKWKLLVETDGSEPELYDLESNPGETVNLAESEPEVTAKMTRKVQNWFWEIINTSSASAEYWEKF